MQDILSLACTSESLPTYQNAAVSQSNSQGPYKVDDVMTYTCRTGFATASSPLTCTCTANDSAASWECNPATDSDPGPCQPGEYSHPVGFCCIGIKKWCVQNTMMAKAKLYSAKHLHINSWKVILFETEAVCGPSLIAVVKHCDQWIKDNVVYNSLIINFVGYD